MEVLIAGGSGLIGTALTRSLVENGHQVTILTRKEQPGASRPGVRFQRWDGRSSLGWEEALERADALVNLVGANLGAKLWTDAYKAVILASRVVPGQAIIAALRKASKRPRLLLQGSAMGIYGISEQETFTESSPAGSDWLSQVAVQWEATTIEAEEMGVRRILARTGLVLDRRDGVLPRMALPFHLMIGGPIGSGRQWNSWIHLRDEVDALRFLLENEQASGPYNLTAPNPVRNAEFGRALGKVINRPYWIPAPAFALRLVLGEMSTLVLDGQKVLPERLLALGYRFHYTKLDDALRAIYLR